ncbi:hypothetical protein H0H93_015630 [Arthromyces matolae]|nr:hypothetical protein H0H93_015630 [Arthromyces matolae]
MSTPASSPVKPLIPFSSHAANVHACVVRDHKQGSKIIVVKSPANFGSAFVGVVKEMRHLNSKPRSTMLATQLGVDFADSTWYGRLLDVKNFAETTAELISLIDTESADDVPALAGLVRLNDALQAIKKERQATIDIVEQSVKPKTTRKRIIKSSKFVATDTDSDGEAPRFIGSKRKANDVLNDGVPSSKRFKTGTVSYEPGSAAADHLLSEVDIILKKGIPISPERLKEYIEVLDRTTVRELFHLDILRQLIDRLLVRRRDIFVLLNGGDNLPNGSVTDAGPVASTSSVPLVPEEDTIMSSKDAEGSTPGPSN